MKPTAFPKTFGIILFAFLWPLPTTAKSIIGWVERTEVLPQKLTLKAKIDTGARTSSLSYHKLNFYDQDGKPHVHVDVWNDRGEKISIDAPVTRVSSVKEQFGKTDKRSTIEMTICLGQVAKKIEVNLADRTGFNYPLLIGRNFLEGDFLVDPAETFLTKPNCTGP